MLCVGADVARIGRIVAAGGIIEARPSIGPHADRSRARRGKRHLVRADSYLIAGVSALAALVAISSCTISLSPSGRS